ncbi:MAG: VOC family protein [Pseudooceanicola sp.]|nr:VOC family protein [Pseudooceanicola sp.]
MSPRICLWYDSEGEAAATFYCSLVPGSGVDEVLRPGTGEPAVLVKFHLGDIPFMALNGGPGVEHTSAASVVLEQKDQAGIDRLWQAILDNGGEEIECGWIQDRWGVRWQIVPEGLPTMVFGPDKAACQRTYAAIHTMKKLDIAGLRAAYEGEGP